MVDGVPTHIRRDRFGIVRWGGGGDVQMGQSVLSFKSYEKGREKWQGETLDGVWFDEEPPIDIYSEGRTRCQARSGIVMVTFTPLQGMTELVKLFLSEADVAKMRELARAGGAARAASSNGLGSPS